jgi:acyl-CoA thioester hydrolase
MEVDAQGVVYNGWYLTYFDEACTAFLADRGLSYKKLLEAGFDTQLVHSEIDWKAPLRWQDDVLVAVSLARLGRASFALDFEACRNSGEPACSARIVYVVVAADGSGKREIPPMLADALGTPAPFRSTPLPSRND